MKYDSWAKRLRDEFVVSQLQIIQNWVGIHLVTQTGEGFEKHVSNSDNRRNGIQRQSEKLIKEKNSLVSYWNMKQEWGDK